MVHMKEDDTVAKQMRGVSQEPLFVHAECDGLLARLISLRGRDYSETC